MIIPTGQRSHKLLQCVCYTFPSSHSISIIRVSASGVELCVFHHCRESSDQEGFVQLHASVRRGDIVGVTGFPGKSKMGELSIFARDFVILSPCLHMLPKTKLTNQVILRDILLCYCLIQEGRTVHNCLHCIIMQRNEDLVPKSPPYMGRSGNCSLHTVWCLFRISKNCNFDISIVETCNSRHVMATNDEMSLHLLVLGFECNSVAILRFSWIFCIWPSNAPET